MIYSIQTCRNYLSLIYLNVDLLNIAWPVDMTSLFHIARLAYSSTRKNKKNFVVAGASSKS
jgi:hypothetical protein